MFWHLHSFLVIVALHGLSSSLHQQTEDGSSRTEQQNCEMPSPRMQKLTGLEKRHSWQKYSLMVTTQINHFGLGQSLELKIAGDIKNAQGKLQILAMHLLSPAGSFQLLVCVLVGLFACPEWSTNAVPSCH